jgi:hypothetical protein
MCRFPLDSYLDSATPQSATGNTKESGNNGLPVLTAFSVIDNGD